MNIINLDILIFLSLNCIKNILLVKISYLLVLIQTSVLKK